MKYFIIAAILATAMAKPSGQRGGPDGDGPFPCLSAEHKASGKTCFEKGFAQMNQSSGQTGTAAGATGNSSFCLPTCVLTEFKALDASNQVIPTALVAVITASNLTDAQKTNATAVLNECLANTSVNASTLMSQCMGGHGAQGGQQGGQQGNRPQGGQQGGRPQGGQQGGRPQGGQRPRPEINMSAECQVAAKGMACLGKALSVNKCGPPCGGSRPSGKPQ